LKQDFGVVEPRIAVLSLNPHAGDGGLLGSEEENVIRPAVQAAANQGVLAFGPMAADGLFASGGYKKYDAILAMYHDQGLAPFKALAFDNGVNYTAGLPFVRTSPDHGTAYDIAGQDKANPDSFRAAIYLALDVFRNRMINKEITSNPMQVRAKQETEKNA
jgi:4-hydroxythreonine-4-phosphate dehydrogenase